MVIKYQVDELLAHGHQSPLLLNVTFILVSQLRCPHQLTSHQNQTVQIIPFWTRLLKTLSRVLLPSLHSTNIPEMDAFFDDADAMPSSVSSELLCLVSTISDHSRLQLAPSIKSHKVWYQARALPLPVPQAGKCQFLS